MRCPRCETEAAVMSAREETREGKAVRVLSFRCRNKRCAEYGRTVSEKTVEQTLTAPETAVEETMGKEEQA